MKKFEDGKTEQTVRPLARLTARALSTEETAQVAGGWTGGISNCGGIGDRDLMN